MKFDLENGLPVWVWGILFVLLVLPFSFRTRPDNPISNQGQEIVVPTVVEIETKEDAVTPFAAEVVPVEPTAVVPPTVNPNATEPFVIDAGGESGYPDPAADGEYPAPIVEE